MKKSEIEDREKLATLLKEAEDSPILKTLRAEKAAAIMATREEAARKIEAAKQERDDVIPKLIEDRDGKEEIFKRAKAALETAGAEFQAARRAVTSGNQYIDHRISQQAEVLIGSADPAIDEAIQYFQEKLSWLRTPGRISRNAIGGERNILTEKIKLTTESNLPAIKSAMEYCQAAIKKLEGMKLLAAMDAERIAALKAGIPKIDVYTEHTGEKPFPRINTDPRSLLPSDSQMNWEIGKLNEKIKKFMGR